MATLSSVDGEVALFRAILKHRPIGAHRHFAVICVCRHLEEDLGRPVPPGEVWKALEGLYDMEAVNAMDEADSEFFKPTLFSEFQLPIHPAFPSDESFLSLIDERRLASHPSPPSSPAVPLAVTAVEGRAPSSGGLRGAAKRARSVRSMSTSVTADQKGGDGSDQDSDLTDPDDEDEDEDGSLQVAGREPAGLHREVVGPADLGDEASARGDMLPTFESPKKLPIPSQKSSGRRRMV